LHVRDWPIYSIFSTCVYSVRFGRVTHLKVYRTGTIDVFNKRININGPISLSEKIYWAFMPPGRRTAQLVVSVPDQSDSTVNSKKIHRYCDWMTLKLKTRWYVTGATDHNLPIRVSSVRLDCS